MLEIKPVQQKTEQERLAKVCRISYRPNDFMYVAYVDGVLSGVSQFGYQDGQAWLHEIVCAPKTEDIDALFIMGRQTANFLNLMGSAVVYAEVGPYAQEPLLRRIGFLPKQDTLFEMNVEGFFDHPCSHS